jgi:hypothetical protein
MVRLTKAGEGSIIERGRVELGGRVYVVADDRSSDLAVFRAVPAQRLCL